MKLANMDEKNSLAIKCVTNYDAVCVPYPGVSQPGAEYRVEDFTVLGEQDVLGVLYHTERETQERVKLHVTVSIYILLAESAQTVLIWMVG